MNYDFNPPPKVERLNNAAPLVERILDHPWENKVTFNPGCALVENRAELDVIIPRLPFDDNVKKILRTYPALCFLLYRAQGAKTDQQDHTRSTIGLAVLSPELKLLARHNQPVILPDKDFDNLGVEDPRISKIGGKYYMLYAAYSSALPENKIRIAVASTEDFVHWEKHGLLNGAFNEINNKNAMFFDGKMNGKFAMLHRPMEGENALTIHWATSDSLLGEWTSRGVLMQPIPNPRFISTWIGGGIPPLLLPNGKYFIVYHTGNRAADGSREYNLGVAIADAASNDFIVQRNEPFMLPEMPPEITADTELGLGHVLFVCGGYFYNGDLFFPYAGADTCVLGAKVRKKEIERYTGNRG